MDFEQTFAQHTEPGFAEYSGQVVVVVAKDVLMDYPEQVVGIVQQYLEQAFPEWVFQQVEWVYRLAFKEKLEMVFYYMKDSRLCSSHGTKYQLWVKIQQVDLGIPRISWNSLSSWNLHSPKVTRVSHTRLQLK